MLTLIPQAIEAGIQDYAHALGAELPEAQFPKIARVGAAFEMVPPSPAGLAAES